MKSTWLLATIFVGYSQLGFAIYGPSLVRAERPIAVLACRQARFDHDLQILQGMRNASTALIQSSLSGALQELRNTPSTSALYPARAFCVHELVPSDLAAQGDGAARTIPTAEVKGFSALGIHYFYYEPDARWILQKDPVDLGELATTHLDSRWGRQAFLMMTRLGWSQGSCQEGPDQFREVIRRAKRFLQEYPASEVSDKVRLEMANAYATWWNVSRVVARNDAKYANGAAEARESAIKLYQAYQHSLKVPSRRVEHRIRQLRDNAKGSGTSDYYCPDYED